MSVNFQSSVTSLHNTHSKEIAYLKGQLEIFWFSKQTSSCNQMIMTSLKKQRKNSKVCQMIKAASEAVQEKHWTGSRDAKPAC